jgi:hypothetical protein
MTGGEGSKRGWLHSPRKFDNIGELDLFTLRRWPFAKYQVNFEIASYVFPRKHVLRFVHAQCSDRGEHVVRVIGTGSLYGVQVIVYTQIDYLSLDGVTFFRLPPL